MLIKFHPPARLAQETIEWTLPEIPRVADSVYFGPGDSAVVNDVLWVLSDDEGNALKAPYVSIYLR